MLMQARPRLNAHYSTVRMKCSFYGIIERPILNVLQGGGPPTCMSINTNTGVIIVQSSRVLPSSQKVRGNQYLQSTCMLEQDATSYLNTNDNI